MLLPAIAALHKMSSAENQTLSTADLLHLTGFSRGELFRIFGNLEQAGIVSKTGYTFLGDIQGYRLKKSLAEIPLLTVLDAVASERELWSVPSEPSTKGCRRYKTACAAFQQNLAAITLEEFQ